jgi:hypothetical protein
VRHGAAVLLFLAVCSAGGAAHAVPRYSARYRQNCTLCHQNPTGGGMRSLYASQFLVPTEMSMVRFTPEQIARIHPDVSPSVNVGVDFRTIHVYTDEPRPESNFFQMQGDLYVSFTVDDRFSANLDVDQVGSVEAYGLGWVLPWSGYVKAGRFTPVFGWKFADHNMFNREELWFDQPFNTDAGIEIGVYPQHLAVWASMLNGEPGTNTIWDTNRELAYTGGALVRFDVARVGFGFGGSIWHNPKEPVSSSTGKRTAGGTFGYVNYSRVTWLWEVDASRLLPPGAPSETKLITSHELSFQVHQGFDVVANYNYVDPDLDLKTGTRSRYGLGVDVIPSPFVQVQGVVNVYRSEPGVAISTADFLRTELQLHLFY